MTPTITSTSPVKLIDEIISRAFADKASDIHIEPGEAACRVRIRLDGALVSIGQYKKEIHEEAMARIKVLAYLRTDVRMSPQDGRFRVNINTLPIHIRVSLVPSYYGEKCVLRLLPSSMQVQSLESLGFSSVDTETISKSLATPHGMMLVVGPTGSGKTTTLYTLLQKLAKPDISAVTLEDPIEYSMQGITQIPIHSGSSSSLTFSSALRTVVRQDPDVIMVGEIRDSQTAELATHVALTGHLLLSTLHTNDAVTALPRLVEMGVEPFLVASTVRMIVSQRLARKICSKCKKAEAITQSESEFLKKHYEISHVTKLYRGQGCASCRNTGYAGRAVIAEVLVLRDEVKGLIMQKAHTQEIQKAALQAGMKTIAHDGIEKVEQGITTLEEIVSLCHVA